MRKCNPDSAGLRQRKQALLPQIAKLAREGLRSREIAEKLALTKSTAARWLRAVQQGSATKKPLDPAELIAKKIARYKRMHRRLIQAWRDSQTDKQVRLVEDTSTAGDNGGSKKKKSIRTETQTGNAAFLAKAMDAQRRIDDLEDRLAALWQTNVARDIGGLPALANLTDDDLEKLTPDDLENFTDDQLFAIEVRLRAKYERDGVKFEEPLLTKEDLHNMTGEQLAALEMRLQREIEMLGAEVPTGETERMASGDRQPPPCQVDPQKCLTEGGPRPEPPGTDTAGAVAAISGPLENPQKANAPKLTWDQERAAYLREQAERKRRMKRYTNPLW